MVEILNFPSIFMIPIDGIDEPREECKTCIEPDIQNDKYLMDFKLNSIIQSLFTKKSKLNIFEKKNQNLNLMIFSRLTQENKRSILSKANSSKIYMGELLSYNWKNKAKKLNLKLKKKFSKMVEDYEIDVNNGNVSNKF